MKEAKLLKKVRCYSLWAAIGSAVLLVVLNILESWGALDFSEASDLGGLGNMMGVGDILGLGGEPTVWGKIQDSLGTILGFSVLIILVLLFASLIRRGGKGRNRCCCTDDKCCEDHSRAMRSMPTATTAKVAPKKR